jgi:hypothetical protein
MEKIEALLEKLDKKVTSSIYRRLEGLNKLEEKFNLAKAEHEANPTEESEADLSEIENYLLDVTEDLIEDLEELVEKREASKNAPAPETTPTSDPIPAEVIEDKEEKSGMSVFGVVLGVALLIGSAGAYNYFNRNR